MSKRIVIIEDDQDTLDLMRYILHDEGYSVIGFNHLVSVMLVAEQQPILILLDNRLGDGYGNTLCLELKTETATADIPIILISAAPNLEALAENCKADGYLSKPFSLSEFIALIRHRTEMLPHPAFY